MYKPGFLIRLLKIYVVINAYLIIDIAIDLLYNYLRFHIKLIKIRILYYSQDIPTN